MLAIQSDWQSGVAHLVAKCSAHLEAVFQTQPIWRCGFIVSPFRGGVSVSAHLEVGFQSQPIWRWGFSLSPFGGSISDSAHLEVGFQSQPIWRCGFSLSPFGGGVSVSAHLEVGFQSQPIWRCGFSLSPFGGGVSVSAHLEAVFQTLAHLEAVSGSASWWLGRAHLGHPCLWAVFQLAVASAFSLLVAVGIPMGVLVVNSCFPAGYFYPFWWLQPFWGFCVAC